MWRKHCASPNFNKKRVYWSKEIHLWIIGRNQGVWLWRQRFISPISVPQTRICFRWWIEWPTSARTCLTPLHSISCRMPWILNGKKQIISENNHQTLTAILYSPEHLSLRLHMSSNLWKRTWCFYLQRDLSRTSRSADSILFIHLQPLLVDWHCTLLFKHSVVLPLLKKSNVDPR